MQTNTKLTVEPQFPVRVENAIMMRMRVSVMGSRIVFEAKMDTRNWNVEITPQPGVYLSDELEALLKKEAKLFGRYCHDRVV